MVHAVCTLFTYLQLPCVTNYEQYMLSCNHIHKDMKFLYQRDFQVGVLYC